jgi:hypothetical protein
MAASSASTRRFLAAGGSGNDFHAGIAWARVAWPHESGTYVKIIDSDAALFA